MYLPRKDLVATGVVGAAGVVYVLWLLDAGALGLHSARVAGAIVLALGFVASASAVVPTFADLLHGNKAYLAVTSSIGLAALVAGVVVLVGASDAGLTALMAATVVLWLITTVHHGMLGERRAPMPPARMHARRLG